MAEPIQINKHGVRFFIHGNPMDPEIIQKMHESMLHLQNMRAGHGPDVDDMRLERTGRFKIRQVFGEVTIHVFGIPFEEEILELEEEEVLEETEETYRFVPAIFINTSDRPWRRICDVSVCSADNWNGVIEIIKDSEANYYGEPGTVCKDGTKNDELEVIACYNWGNADFWWSWDGDYDGVEDTESNTYFNPAPYLGHSLDGAVDHAWEEALAGGAVYYWPLATPVPICPGVEADIKAADEGWTSTGLKYARSDDYTVSYDPPQCRNDWWGHTYLVFRYHCGGGHLFFEYEVEGWQEHQRCDGLVYMYGFCIGYNDTYCAEAVNTWPVARSVGGGAQTRGLEWTYSLPYFGYSDDDLQRSDGEFYFDFDYMYETTETRAALMTAPCVTSQSDTYYRFEIFPEYQGWPGAYIQDIGEPEYICPVESFYNKYFLMIVEEYSERNISRTCPQWAVTGYGYDAEGVYDHGGVSTCSGTSVDEETTYRILCINLNGERIEIDVGDDEHDYFEVSDSCILDFMGTPIYMYAYYKTRYTNGDYDGIYTRYGYFMNDKHYQSEKFYPAGITNYSGRISVLHDVYGSMNIGEYGYGECSGYVIKETTTKKGAVKREPNKEAH